MPPAAEARRRRQQGQVKAPRNARQGTGSPSAGECPLDSNKQSSQRSPSQLSRSSPPEPTVAASKSELVVLDLGLAADLIISDLLATKTDFGDHRQEMSPCHIRNRFNLSIIIISPVPSAVGDNQPPDDIQPKGQEPIDSPRSSSFQMRIYAQKRMELQRNRSVFVNFLDQFHNGSFLSPEKKTHQPRNDLRIIFISLRQFLTLSNTFGSGT
jgi:hypothetical protein